MDGVSGPSPPPADLADRVASVLAIPLHRFLGVRLRRPDDPAAGITVDVGDAARNNADVLHGGVVTALLDVACYLALLPELAAGENAVTHDLTASLLRPVALGSQLQLTGTVVRRGRTVAFLRAEATVEGVVVAFGQVTKTVLGPSPG